MSGGILFKILVLRVNEMVICLSSEVLNDYIVRVSCLVLLEMCGSNPRKLFDNIYEEWQDENECVSFVLVPFSQKCFYFFV
jgi:hypothetical protein